MPLIYKSLRAIVELFFSNIFQPSIFDEKLIPSQLLKLFLDMIQYFHDLTQLLFHVENIFHHYPLDLLLLFPFLSSQENQYMIHQIYNLFCEICNTAVELNQKQNHSLSLLSLNQVGILKEVTPKLINNFICITILHLHLNTSLA